MTFSVKHQDSYSRGKLLLRTFFGWLYIGIPHIFLLGIFGIWSGIINFISFWMVLFTGKYNKDWYQFQVKYLAWYNRFLALTANLTDESAALMPDGTSESVIFQAECPESLSRGKLLLRAFFGWAYILIPHSIALGCRIFVTQILMFVAWWMVLLTGNYPENFHSFVVGTFRWTNRLMLTVWNMTDENPKFSGKE